MLIFVNILTSSRWANVDNIDIVSPLVCRAQTGQSNPVRLHASLIGSYFANITGLVMISTPLVGLEGLLYLLTLAISQLFGCFLGGYRTAKSWSWKVPAPTACAFSQLLHISYAGSISVLWEVYKRTIVETSWIFPCIPFPQGTPNNEKNTGVQLFS